MIPHSSSIVNKEDLFSIDENGDAYHNYSSDDFNFSPILSPIEPFEFTDETSQHDQNDLAQSNYPCNVPNNPSDESPPQTILNKTSHENHSLDDYHSLLEHASCNSDRNNPNEDDQQQNPTDQGIIQQNSNNFSNIEDENEQSEVDFPELIIDNDNEMIDFDEIEEITLNDSNIIKQMPSKKGRHSGKTPKIKVNLSQKEENFRTSYYLLFLKKKKVFNKSYVKMIHEYMRGFLHFPPMTRKQFRTISYYFKDYAAYDSQIISFLNDHKNDVLQLMPGLCQMK